MGEDRIIYSVVTQPGGVDGMDHTDKGGAVVLVTLDKTEATKYVGHDTRYRIDASVTDLETVAKSALAKLSKLERFALTNTMKG